MSKPDPVEAARLRILEAADIAALAETMTGDQVAQILRTVAGELTPGTADTPRKDKPHG